MIHIQQILDARSICRLLCWSSNRCNSLNMGCSIAFWAQYQHVGGVGQGERINALFGGSYVPISPSPCVPDLINRDCRHRQSCNYAGTCIVPQEIHAAPSTSITAECMRINFKNHYNSIDRTSLEGVVNRFLNGLETNKSISTINRICL